MPNRFLDYEIKMICEDCKKNEAVIKFSDEPIFAMTHGFGIQNICRECYIQRIEKILKNIKYNLIKQKRLLKSQKYITPKKDEHNKN